MLSLTKPLWAPHRNVRGTSPSSGTSIDWLQKKAFSKVMRLLHNRRPFKCNSFGGKTQHVLGSRQPVARVHLPAERHRWEAGCEKRNLGKRSGMAARLLIHSLSSHVYSQGTACATVVPASAGTDGRGTLAKSGWGLSTEERSWRGEEEEKEEEEEEKVKAQAAWSNRTSRWY